MGRGLATSLQLNPVRLAALRNPGHGSPLVIGKNMAKERFSQVPCKFCGRVLPKDQMQCIRWIYKVTGRGDGWNLCCQECFEKRIKSYNIQYVKISPGPRQQKEKSK